MSGFAFTRAERVQLLGDALRAFVQLRLEILPPRGKPDADGNVPPGKKLPGRLDRVAAAWALSTVDNLEYAIKSDIDYREKKAAEARERVGTMEGAP